MNPPPHPRPTHTPTQNRLIVRSLCPLCWNVSVHGKIHHDRSAKKCVLNEKRSYRFNCLLLSRETAKQPIPSITPANSRRDYSKDGLSRKPSPRGPRSCRHERCAARRHRRLRCREWCSKGQPPLATYTYTTVQTNTGEKEWKGARIVQYVLVVVTRDPCSGGGVPPTSNNRRISSPTATRRKLKGPHERCLLYEGRVRSTVLVAPVLERIGMLPVFEKFGCHKPIPRWR